METILRQLNAVPRVIGSLVCDTEGHLLAHAFPAVFDPTLLLQAARLAPDGSAGLERALGPVATLDLRYGEARILVRRQDRTVLLVLCAPEVSSPLLAMSAGVAIGKLDKVLVARSAPPPPAEPAARPAAPSALAPRAPLAAARPAPAPEPAAATATGQLLRLVRRIDETIARRKLDGFKIRGEIALKAGFGLGFIASDTPDDPARVDQLRAAAAAVLNERV